MHQWTAFPHLDDYAFDASSLASSWQRLHQGDCEPLPSDPDVLQAWALFHQGAFQKATEAGIQAGGDGLTVANKASCVYANYLEPKEKNRLELLLEVATRAEMQQALDPLNANAWFWQGYALGRYCQGISVAKALAQGMGSKIKHALEHAITLSPTHADAHIALAAFHAEVIDKVGPLIGSMTYGVKKETGLALFSQAMRLNPSSPIALIEYANGLVMLEGEKTMPVVTALYEQAAASVPADATEQLEVELAKVELED